MKILVAVKRVIDYNVKIRVKADHSDVELNNVKMALNPFCEIAVEAAVRLKESGVADEIVVVTIGPEKAQEQIRSAMAMGADRGVWVETDSTALNPLSIAKLLAKVVADEQPGLVLTGKQAIDSDNNQTGQMLAALTGYPQATFASEITLRDSKLHVVREVDGGLQTLELDLPAIVTTDLRLNEPRYIKLPAIMKAKKKPIQVTSPEALGVPLTDTIRLLRVDPPAERTPGMQVANVDELLDCLKNQAKVL